jgi:hypothetical protein
VVIWMVRRQAHGRDPDIPAGSQALDHALSLYESYAGQLARAVEAFRVRGELDKSDCDTLRSFQKTLLMVLDFESKLSRRRRGSARDAGAAIDLDAARGEVARRLARLAAAAEA